MKRSRFLIVILICILSSGLEANAQWMSFVADDTASVVDYRMLDTASVLEYQNDWNYQYGTKPVNTESWWDQLKRWFWNTFIRPVGQGEINIKSILVLLFAIIAIGFMFYYFIISRGKTERDRKDVTWGEVFDNPMEVSEFQFKKWIQKSEEEGNYSEALKYLYLWCIRQLDKQNFVHYRPQYTNRQVLRRLTDTQVKEVFRQISSQFEYVWYGKYDVDEQAYTNLKEVINQSKLTL